MDEKFHELYEVLRRVFNLTAGDGALRFNGVANEYQSCRLCRVTDAEL